MKVGDLVITTAAIPKNCRSVGLIINSLESARPIRYNVAWLDALVRGHPPVWASADSLKVIE